MSSAVERALGITDTTFYEATVNCLKEIGATRPSKAVVTLDLARELGKRGIKRSPEEIGEQLGSYQMMSNGQMRFLAHRYGKDEKDWRKYEWYVLVPSDDPAHPDA